MPTRRDFIKSTAAAAAALAAPPLQLSAPAQAVTAPSADPLVMELAGAALDAARSAGASYADVRIGRYRRQYITTRERRVGSVRDDESYGLGLRTLVDGSWGFAATSVLTRAAVQKVAGEAVALSRAARTVQRRPVELAPAPTVTGLWITPIKRDPVDVPLEDKIALLLKANEAALKVRNVRFVSSSLALLREVKTLVTSEGTNVTQTTIRVGPQLAPTIFKRTKRSSRRADRDGSTSNRSTCPEMPSAGRRWPPRSSRQKASSLDSTTSFSIRQTCG
jgi:TldD protein